MATTPDLSPYHIDWTRTGRARMAGDWFSATCRVFDNGHLVDLGPGEDWTWVTTRAAGKATGHGISMIPVATWQEYPTGIFEVVWITATGLPTTGSDAVVKQSYDEAWQSERNYPYTATIHKLEFRFFAQLWDYNNGDGTHTTCYWLSTGGGSIFVDGSAKSPPRAQRWLPSLTTDLEATFEYERLVTCKEQVNIDQTNWSWSRTPKFGMSDTAAEFRDISDEPASGFVAGGISVNGVAHRRPYVSGYVFSSTRNISMRAGLVTPITRFGYNSSPTFLANFHAFGIAAKLAACSVGTADGVNGHNLRLGYASDHTTPVQYRAWEDAAESIEAIGLGDAIEYWSTAGGTGYIEAAWTNLGMAYRFDGTTEYMDGSAPSPAPAYLDESGSAVAWTGDTSPDIAFAGTWILTPKDLSGGSVANHTPADGWSVDHWAQTDPAPSALKLSLTNGGSYNPGSLSDDRVMILYPRSRYALDLALAQTTDIDTLDTVSPTSDGLAGWTAVNCTLALVAGKLEVTDATAGAKVYRADFWDDAPADKAAHGVWRPKHWPAQRFCLLNCEAYAGAVREDYALTLTAIRNHPSAGVVSRVFSHSMAMESGGNQYAGRYDTCKPVGAGRSDTEKSYMEESLPEERHLLASGFSYRTEANPSWSCGVGCFDRVEISGFLAGRRYVLDSLQGHYNKDAGAHAVANIEREYNPVWQASGDAYEDAVQDGRAYWHAGDRWLTTDDAPDPIYKSIYFDRIGILGINGKWAFEFCCRRSLLSNIFYLRTDENLSAEQALVNKGETGIDPAESYGFYPKDDFAAIAVTDLVGWDPTWWSGSEYTSEDAIFSPKYCPMAWLNAVVDGATPGIDYKLYLRPLLDSISVNNWWGDGTGDAGVRQGVVVIPFVKRLMGRVDGIAWRAGLPPDEVWPDPALDVFNVRYSSSYLDAQQTDRLGFVDSAWHIDPVDVLMADTVHATPIYNRRWFRVCGDVITATAVYGCTNSKRAGRTYLLYNEQVDGPTVRIYDHDHKTHVDRAVGVTMESSRGICLREDRKDSLRIAYSSAGTVYIIESLDEGRTWSAPVSVAVGTNPSVKYFFADGCEMLAYINDSANACVRRRLGTGAYGAEIVIAAATDVTATPIRDSRQGLWVAFLRDAAGNISRYKSFDSGKNWSLDV